MTAPRPSNASTECRRKNILEFIEQDAGIWREVERFAELSEAQQVTQADLERLHAVLTKAEVAWRMRIVRGAEVMRVPSFAGGLGPAYDQALGLIIARLKRAQPRNQDTLAVCSALEGALRTVREFERFVTENNGQVLVTPVVSVTSLDKVLVTRNKGGRPRKADALTAAEKQRRYRERLRATTGC